MQGSTFVVVTVAVGCLRLEGRMGDAMLGKLVFESFCHLWPMGQVVNDHMRRKCRLGGADGPHMDVVCAFHMLFFGKQLLNLLQVDTLGNTVYSQPQTI